MSSPFEPFGSVANVTHLRDPSRTTVWLCHAHLPTSLLILLLLPFRAVHAGHCTRKHSSANLLAHALRSLFQHFTHDLKFWLLVPACYPRYGGRKAGQRPSEFSLCIRPPSWEMHLRLTIGNSLSVSQSVLPFTFTDFVGWNRFQGWVTYQNSFIGGE